MNKERMEVLIDHLRNIPKQEFDMNRFFNSCGAPSCIAGHTVVLFDVRNTAVPIREQAAHILDITDEQSVALFIPGFAESKDGRINPYDATNLGAAFVLENFMHSGIIDWSLIMYDPSYEKSSED